MSTAQNRKITTTMMAAVGLMAAFVFVATNFRINIPTPLGKTMLHFGNVFCLLSGVLLGPIPGGLAAGFGSFFFDLTSDYASGAPWTLINKFMMAFICGLIAHSRGRKGEKAAFNIIGAVCGSVTYMILYIGRGALVDLFLQHAAVEAVIGTYTVKGLVTLTNGVIAMVFSTILAPVFQKAMHASGIDRKMFPPKAVANE